MKTLTSGVQVNDELYYKLLEWKDKHMDKFKQWCDNRDYPYSINSYSQEQFDDLLWFFGSEICGE